jgi:hypothetical protein
MYRFAEHRRYSRKIKVVGTQQTWADTKRKICRSALRKICAAKIDVAQNLRCEEAKVNGEFIAGCATIDLVTRRHADATWRSKIGDRLIKPDRGTGSTPVSGTNMTQWRDENGIRPVDDRAFAERFCVVR